MRLRLLAIESEPDIARMLALIFPHGRYDVRLAGTLEAGRRALRERRIDMVLLELLLPDGDGLALCRQLRKAHPRLPIVVVTTQVQASKAARAAGASAFVAKPFDPEALVAEVKRLVWASRARRRRA